MNFENESNIWPDCLGIIIDARLICCADLPQLRTGRFDYFANAKAAADLDRLTARNDNFQLERRTPRSRPAFASGEMMNDYYQRSCAIVHDRGRFGSAKQRERILDISAAATALAGREIIFEISIT